VLVVVGLCVLCVCPCVCECAYALCVRVCVFFIRSLCACVCWVCMRVFEERVCVECVRVCGPVGVCLLRVCVVGVPFVCTLCTRVRVFVVLCVFVLDESSCVCVCFKCLGCVCNWSRGPVGV